MEKRANSTQGIPLQKSSPPKPRELTARQKQKRDDKKRARREHWERMSGLHDAAQKEGAERAAIETSYPKLPSMPLRQVGFVYLISNLSFHGWIKIGSTANLEKRLAAYQTGDPFRRYELLARYKIEKCRVVERWLHQKFRLSSGDVRGEWFRLDAQKALAIFREETARLTKRK